MRESERAGFQIERAGFYTTVQDLGRFGYQRFGVPVSGAMDSIALRLANRLVGNPDGAAALEITLNGPELIFETEAILALTGADLSPMINLAPVPLWTAREVGRGDTLSFGERRSGARTYLAVAGGIDVPVVLGSRATHVASRTGGFLGRPLANGDRVICGIRGPTFSQLVGRTIPVKARPPYSSRPIVRVVLGPQADDFSAEALESFARERYTITPHADRMGYRLTGAPLSHRRAPDMPSDATPLGSVQVPPDQQPILLMADRQTTGGYPKIGVVITADLPLAAQLLPGDTIEFAVVDVNQAQAIAQDQWATLTAGVSEW